MFRSTDSCREAKASGHGVGCWTIVLFKVVSGIHRGFFLGVVATSPSNELQNWLNAWDMPGVTNEFSFIFKHTNQDLKQMLEEELTRLHQVGPRNSRGEAAASSTSGPRPRGKSASNREGKRLLED